MKRSAKGTPKGAPKARPPPRQAGPTALVAPEAVLAIAREKGMPELGPGVAAFVAQTVEYRLQELLQDAAKVRTQSRRRTLIADDVNFMLKLRTGQALIGYGSGVEKRPVTSSDGSAATAELNEAGEMCEDLAKAMQRDLPRQLPLEPGLVLHWLAIDGVQPVIPYNPPPTPQQADATGPQGKVEGGALLIPEKSHPLTEELYTYYNRALKAITHGNDSEKAPFFASLSSDPGLQELVPYLCRHIHTTVDAAVTGVKAAPLAPLTNMVKLARCLVVNPHMHLELYLHQVLPSIMTVVANQRLGGQPDEQAPLRDFAAQTLAIIVRKYGAPYQDLYVRICRTFAERIDAFAKEPKASRAPVGVLFGSILGLRSLGGRAVEVVLMPTAQKLLRRLEAMVGDRSLKLRRRQEAMHCKAALLGAVGDYLDRRQQVSESAARVEDMLAQQESSKLLSGLWCDALLPYAAPNLRLPEHLLCL